MTRRDSLAVRVLFLALLLGLSGAAASGAAVTDDAGKSAGTSTPPPATAAPEKELAELERQITLKEMELSDLRIKAERLRSAMTDDFWKTADPAKVGLDAAAVERHLDHAKRTGADGVLVVYKGQIVSEWYSSRYREPIGTMSSVKSWTALLVGMLIADGKIKSVDDPVSTYLPEWGEGDKAKVTVRHLLTMTSGLKRRTGIEPGDNQSVGFVDDKDAFVRQLSLSYQPGERWDYSNEGAQLLSPILDRAAGCPIQDYAHDRLFKPIGMTRTRLYQDSKGHAWTYADAQTTVRDFARIGILMRNEGRWGRDQVVPAAWVRESTRPCRQNQRYGYLWWLLDDPRGFATKGYLDTNCYVLPSLDLVVVRMQREPSKENLPNYEPAALEMVKAMVPGQKQ